MAMPPVASGSLASRVDNDHHSVCLSPTPAVEQERLPGKRVVKVDSSAEPSVQWLLVSWAASGLRREECNETAALRPRSSYTMSRQEDEAARRPTNFVLHPSRTLLIVRPRSLAAISAEGRSNIIT
ncbi:hypothetical protein ABZP36_033661 [Zizania latifolia]